jgi:hypothetical protein
MCGSFRTGDPVFGRSVSDLLSEEAASGFAGNGCCGGGAGGSENLAFRFMSLIGESFVGSIGDDLADSFFGSVDNIVLMY